MEDDERKQLMAIIERQAAEIAVLRQTIDALVKRVFGAKSESLDPAQLELLLDSETAKKPDAAGPEPAADLEADLKPKPERKDALRQPRIPDHLPEEEEVVIPLEVQGELEKWRCIGEEVRELLDYRRGYFLRRRLVRRKFVRIDDPLSKPVIAPLPPGLQERCTVAPGLVAEVVTNRFVCHLPYYRQSEIFARQGVALDRKTLCDWALLASDWLSAIYREIRREHQHSGYNQIDETPIRFLEPGNGKARTGYLWTSNIPGGSVLYHWQAGRDQSGIDALLGMKDAETAQLARIIQCDGFSAYPSWAKDKLHIMLMGCHAHVRRKFFEAKEQSPKLVGWILRQIAHLYRVEEELRQTRAGPVMREVARAASSRMIHQRLKKAIERLAARRSILPQSLLGKALRYARNQWQQLEVYLANGRVEIDNNLVENAIRPAKLGAKNWLFMGNEESGTKNAILYTIVENCRRLKIDPREYIEDVLTRLPAMKEKDVATLTPENWLKAKQAGKGRAMLQAA